MSEQSNTEGSVLPTSVTLKMHSDYSSKHDVRAYIKTSSELAIDSNIDMSSSAYSLAVKNNSEAELNERKNIHSTTTRNIKKSRSPQFSTGTFDLGLTVCPGSTFVSINVIPFKQ